MPHVPETPRPVALLARLRVPLGFLFGVIVLWLARPTPATLAAGGSIAALGEALRLWAAGHLEKSREVTRSGPYRWIRHPLYAGSALMGIGMALAASNRIVVAMVALYLGLTFSVAIRTEEQWLRARFGEEYDAYARGELVDRDRSFSLSRAMRNKEYRALTGLVAVLVLLAVKAWWLAS